MSARKNSKKGKGSYAAYKTENRVRANKIKKLERHCKQFPNDEQGKINLARIQKEGYECRKKPLNPGSNQTTARNPMKGFIHHPLPKTPGEQLSELLGIPLVKTQRKRVRKGKAPVTYKKKRRNVKS